MLGHKHVVCLSKCTWILESLSLCETWLDTRAFAHLSNGDWPDLKKLDLCNNHDPQPSAAVAQLVKGRWPLLEWLSLCGNRSRDACVLGKLIKGDWPLLKTLQLAGNAFTPESAAELIQGNWPLLQKLSVTCRTLNKSVVQTLTRGNWPILTELSLMSTSSREYSHNISDSWCALCNDMCESRWPGIQLFSGYNYLGLIS